MKNILIAIIVIVVSVVGCDKQSSDENKTTSDTTSDTIGKAVVNTALQVSELDVNALSGITEKLKGSCAKNKYGLSEDQCIQAIEERKAICMQETAQKFPGQLSNVDRMQAVVSSHLDCLFQKK